jgi:hypothetical protein
MCVSFISLPGIISWTVFSVLNRIFASQRFPCPCDQSVPGWNSGGLH